MSLDTSKQQIMDREYSEAIFQSSKEIDGIINWMSWIQLLHHNVWTSVRSWNGWCRERNLKSELSIWRKRSIQCTTLILDRYFYLYYLDYKCGSSQWRWWSMACIGYSGARKYGWKCCSHCNSRSFLSSFLFLILHSGTSHCMDQFAATPNDPPELTQARKTILDNIKKWLGEYELILNSQ